MKERILTRHMQVVFKYLKESLVEERRKFFLSVAGKKKKKWVGATRR